jgi:hypothetical protein
LRFAALCALAALIAACAPVEAPRLGSGPPVLSPKTLKTLSKPAPSATDVEFALDPITNAPGEMIYAFEDTLKAAASTRQLKIVDAGDQTATYRLKAYLSAVGDYSGTLMIYVLDVFDSSGQRVHRVSGQVNAGGSLSDPWANIKDTGVVNQAAQEAVDALGNWAHS